MSVTVGVTVSASLPEVSADASALTGNLAQSTNATRASTPIADTPARAPVAIAASATPAAAAAGTMAGAMARPAVTGKWSGPYLSKAVPQDPWGKPYIYRSPASKGDYELLGRIGAAAQALDVALSVHAPLAAFMGHAELGKKYKTPHWFEMSRRIENLVTGEKKLYPNVDFYSASTYYTLGMDEAFRASARQLATGATASRHAPILNTQLMLDAYRRGDYAGAITLSKGLGETQRGRLARYELFHMTFQPFKERKIANEPIFDHLCEPGRELAVLGVEEVEAADRAVAQAQRHRDREAACDQSVLGILSDESGAVVPAGVRDDHGERRQ